MAIIAVLGLGFAVPNGFSQFNRPPGGMPRPPQGMNGMPGGVTGMPRPNM
jgi:hypothetical protein